MAIFILFVSVFRSTDALLYHGYRKEMVKENVCWVTYSCQFILQNMCRVLLVSDPAFPPLAKHVLYENTDDVKCGCH